MPRTKKAANCAAFFVRIHLRRADQLKLAAYPELTIVFCSGSISLTLPAMIWVPRDSAMSKRRGAAPR